MYNYKSHPQTLVPGELLCLSFNRGRVLHAVTSAQPLVFVTIRSAQCVILSTPYVSCFYDYFLLILLVCFT